MRIFITGASGFAGGAVAKALQANHEIVTMARSDNTASKLSEAGYEVQRCSLGEVALENLQNCEVVIHCAAFVEDWGKREQFWNTNVKGTAQLLEVAKQAGVKYFVHVSTESSLYYGQDMQDVDETHPYPKTTPFLYSETKKEAEKSVLKANSEEFRTVVLRPRLIWGPGDQTILPELTRMAKKGKFLWINHGKAVVSTTHIDNFVHAIQLILKKQIAGEIYFISDDNKISLKEFVSSLMATQEISLPQKSIPSWLARGMSLVIERLWKVLFLKSKPPLTYLAACMMSNDCTVCINKAKNELGYKPVTTVEKGFYELHQIFLQSRES